MQQNITRFNKTFNIGKTHLNACVGDNGIQDHETYGEGFDYATKLLINVAKKDSANIDATIYPLVFCARHRLELFLKDQLFKLTQIRENNAITESALIKTHDLKILWDMYKENGPKTDSRLSGFINKYEEIFLDFAEIDATGETFRYPYSKFKALHLIETPIINIEILGKRYNTLSKKIKYIEWLTNYLIDEYRQGTFTKKLSREDIKNISISLPNRDKWTDENFSKIKDEFKKKYNIGSRELTKSINIIKEHREFCVNIGLEINIKQINDDEFEHYIKLYNHLYDSDHNNNNESAFHDFEEIFKYNGLQHDAINELLSTVSKDAIICIYTLIELGRDGYFGEAYDMLYEKFTKIAENKYDYSENCRYIFTNCRALELIKRGLKKSGQKTLLAKLITN